jgi:aminoglycoside/choline kinase family phosphotransferase
MPFVSVARLMAAIPLPVPAILATRQRPRHPGLEDLGDVTLQAHLGVATPAEHAALYRQAVGFIASCSGAAPSSRRRSTRRTASRSMSRSSRGSSSSS